jgi:hypothetical protein
MQASSIASRPNHAPAAVSPSIGRRLRRAATTLAVALLLPHAAEAHVKWFAPYDVSERPTPIAVVMNAHFIAVLAAFILMMSAGFLLDRLASRRSAFRALAAFLPVQHAELEEKLLRAGIGAFFMALFTMGGIILTPELQTGAVWPAWLQLAIAASMLARATCILGALGVLVLYGYGVGLYGVFHLGDYPMFLGIAGYLALTSMPSPWLRAQRMLILFATLCVSLMWAAIEKFAYPQWTFPVLEARPYLTMGMQPADFMIVAGFVEFALAFYILTGLGLLRLGIAGLTLIFSAAIVDFGKLDAIGHLPTLTCLAAMFVHGPSTLHHRLHHLRRGLLAEAGRAGCSFATGIGIFFVAYYGLQHAEFWRDGIDQRHAVLTTSSPVLIR